ncbi:MAG: ABC transporter permease [Chitinophagaceae bacterium]|nr:ABC transporter permease [Chitinophagaceae bacterium]
MNTAFFIAKRLAFKEKKSFSSFIIRIALLAVSLSVCVMIISTAITRGYQQVISEKFYDCWGHLHVTTFLEDPGSLLNDEKITKDDQLISDLQKMPEIKSVNTYRIQSAMLKTSNDMEGILLKGLSGNEGDINLNRYIVAGNKVNFNQTVASNDIMISSSLAKKMELNVGHTVKLYFLNKNEYQPKIRKGIVRGIYNTGLEDYDNVFAICDARLLNSVNDDSINVIQGYEIYLKDKNLGPVVEERIFDQYLHPPLEVYRLEKRFGNIFSWLNMMRMNEKIIIIIMMIIAIINMITALLILILERTRMIGVLKALGMPNIQIQSVFLYSSIYIVGIGVAIGTLVGTALCWFQLKFGWIRLDEATYYVKTVPIQLNASIIVMIDVLTIVICLLLLLIPSYLIRTISSVKALQFT